MSIQISTTHWLRDQFEERGWSHLPTPPSGRRFGMTVMVARDGQSAALLLGPIPLRPPHRVGRDLQVQFEDWLHRLLEQIDRHLTNETVIRHLFFTGGGPITLPRWFREACETRGIHRPHTVRTDAPPPDLDVFMKRPG